MSSAPRLHAKRFPASLANGTPRTGPGGASPPLRPQRLLHQAAQDTARLAAPTGLGLDSAPVRARMVERLRKERVCGDSVLEAMGRIERHLFVDSALVAQGYEDTSLPIGHGQTISKPSVVARMLGLLCDGAWARRHGGLGRVLEIGTGCGYQAALLRLLAREVFSIERVGALHERARRNLAPLSFEQLTLVHGDGIAGLAEHAPYQSIVAAAGGEELPSAWIDQLALGGRLVAPVRTSGSSGQVLVVVDRRADGSIDRAALDGVRFVPLESGTR